MKKFWKMLEENESLLNLVTADVCFAIIGIIALLCWLFGQVVRMIKRKIKRKTFKDNDSYFEFYNKMKDVINIISVKLLEDKIKIEYENKEVL